MVFVGANMRYWLCMTCKPLVWPHSQQETGSCSNRCRLDARSHNTSGSTTTNLGFRGARDV